MKVALIGYGKMGKMIEEVAVERGHQIGLIIDESNRDEFTLEQMKDIDVAIEFTSPLSAFENVLSCIDFKVPVVCGSTGWNEELPGAKEYCLKNNGTFLHASNFSIGVNIFFQINQLLARLMNDQPSYEVSIKEIHHTQKKDAPSGTAVTIAEQVIQNIERKKTWVNKETENPDEVSVLSERIDPAPGTHFVKYSSSIDDIEIIHTAHNRKGFALGAVLAAEYIHDKSGVFTMNDVLHL